jgi:hypothetical protein
MRRTVFSDLQLTARGLYSLEWCRPRRCRAACDAVRHTSPETKRRYQLGMTDQVRQAVEQANEKADGREKVLRIITFGPMRKRKKQRLSVTN